VSMLFVITFESRANTSSLVAGATFDFLTPRAITECDSCFKHQILPAKIMAFSRRSSALLAVGLDDELPPGRMNIIHSVGPNSE
jgi:hypothetical protein